MVNLGHITRSGTRNAQSDKWDAEAEKDPEFAKLVRFRSALARRGVRMLTGFDSLFMRVYAALASIPSHRDAGRGRLRIVGNSGRDRKVDFALHSVGDFSEDIVASAERLQIDLAHGWAYALTNIGSGRLPLKPDVETCAGSSAPSRFASVFRSGRSSPPPPPCATAGPQGDRLAAERLVDLAVAHEVQPTSAQATLTMAWVIDLDETCCDGCEATILDSYQEAVLEVLALGLCLGGCRASPRLHLSHGPIVPQSVPSPTSIPTLPTSHTR